MREKIQKVFVVGATGFLGYYSSLEFLKKNVAVGTFTRTEFKKEAWFPEEIDVVRENLDVFEATQEELVEVFRGYDAMVYSVGPDDRVTPPAPAYDFFYEKLVVQCIKVVKAARLAGIKKVVIMNSYFAYFDRQFDGLLSKNHPYVLARVEQAEACIKEGEEGVMDVMILELPYIFGCMPGREPLWKEVFLKRFEKANKIFFPKGGTVMVHVRDVGRIVVASIFNGKHGARYPVGVVNMKYKKMIELMYGSLNEKKEIFIIPTCVGYLAGLVMNYQAKKRGKEGGLNYARLIPDILARDLYYSKDLIDSIGKELLCEPTFDVIDGIKEAVQACYPEKFPDFNPVDSLEYDLGMIKKIWKKS